MNNCRTHYEFITFNCLWHHGIDLIQNPRMHLFHIPQCSIQNINVHISVLNEVLWDMEQVYFGIWSIGSSLLPSRRPAITCTNAHLVFIGDSRKIFVTFESIKIHQFSLNKKSIWKYCLRNVSLNGLNNMFTLKGCSYDRRLLNMTYRQACNISRTLVSNKIVDHSDAVGASPVGVAPTASSYST